MCYKYRDILSLIFVNIDIYFNKKRHELPFYLHQNKLSNFLLLQGFQNLVGASNFIPTRSKKDLAGNIYFLSS